MNPRIAKEYWSFAPLLKLAVVCLIPILLGWREKETFLGLYSLACVVASALVFGNEFQFGTMGLLLAQPVPRERVWKEKMLPLAWFLIGATAFLALGYLIFARQVFSMGFELLLFLLIPFMSFCTTPWWTLATRSTIGGIVASIGAPLVVMLIYDTLCERVFHFRSVHVQGGIGVGILFAYSAACYWGARRHFQNLQLIEGRSPELTVHPFFDRVPFLQRIAGLFQGPFSTLLKKELRLQQLTFIAAGLFFLAGLGFSILDYSHRGGPNANNWGEILMMVDFFMAIVLIPLMAGTLCICEERAWGVADTQLTQPPSARKQWLAKMLVAYPTSLALGYVLPAAAALFINWIHHRREFAADFAGMPWQIPIFYAVIHLLFLSISIFSASLSSNTVKAMVLAITCLSGLISWIFFVIQTAFRYFQYHPSLAMLNRSFERYWDLSQTFVALLFLASAAVFIRLLQGFAFSNFRSRGPQLRRAIVQCAILAVTSAILTLAVLCALIWVSYY